MEAAVAGGFRVVEFTLNTPNALEHIAAFAQRPDLLVGAYADSTYGRIRGVAQVISGSDWSVLREHTGTYSQFGGTVSALGDATGDGVSEYLVCEAWHQGAGAVGVKLHRAAVIVSRIPRSAGC